jgi:hypothetical protein
MGQGGGMIVAMCRMRVIVRIRSGHGTRFGAEKRAKRLLRSALLHYNVPNVQFMQEQTKNESSKLRLNLGFIR